MKSSIAHEVQPNYATDQLHSCATKGSQSLLLSCVFGSALVQGPQPVLAIAEFQCRAPVLLASAARGGFRRN